MHERRPTDVREHPRDPDLEEEVLISRLVDGEATDEERQRFEHLAASEPTLWRALAVRHQDMSILADQVRDATAGVERTELPARWHVPRRVSWPLVLSGWAAVIVLAASWMVVSLAGVRAPSGSQLVTQRPAGAVTLAEHLEEYESAPYVLGTMEPEILDVESLSDGRVAVHFVRKIEEVAFLDPKSNLPVDANGDLTKDPIRLRESEPVVGFPGMN